MGHNPADGGVCEAEVCPVIEIRYGSDFSGTAIFSMIRRVRS